MPRSSPRLSDTVMPSSAQSEKSTPFSGVREKVHSPGTPSVWAQSGHIRLGQHSPAKLAVLHAALFPPRLCKIGTAEGALAEGTAPPRLAVNLLRYPCSPAPPCPSTVPPKRQLENGAPINPVKDCPQKSQFWNRHRCRHTRRSLSPDKSAARHSPSTAHVLHVPLFPPRPAHFLLQHGSALLSPPVSPQHAGFVDTTIAKTPPPSWRGRQYVEKASQSSRPQARIKYQSGFPGDMCVGKTLLRLQVLGLGCHRRTNPVRADCGFPRKSGFATFSTDCAPAVGGGYGFRSSGTGRAPL